MRNTIKFLLENSMFLILGTVGALVWANVDMEGYDHFLHTKLLEDTIVGQVDHDGGHEAADGHEGGPVGGEQAADDQEKGLDVTSVAEDHGDHAPRKKSITFHYLINDILMALFFAIAGKEVWEATFPGGPLSNPRKAATPLIATLGGMAGPAFFFVLVAVMSGQLSELSNGWAIPCATDIAFSYMVARMVFGGGHPAIPFLLLLAIADDALGLVILAIFYPNPDLPVAPMWLLLCVGAVLVGFALRRLRVHSFWPYLVLGGTMSWFGFALAGLHPALGLLPVIPTMPHAHVDTGLFDWSKLEKDDTLTHFERWMKNPVELVLGMFGLLNAGVVLSSAGVATAAVLVGLLVGKPVGIVLCGYIAARMLKFGLPDGMNLKDLVVVGCAAAIGFTVALFITTVAFQPGGIQDAAKMGALGSFGAAIVTVIVARMMGTKKVLGTDSRPAVEED